MAFRGIFTAIYALKFSKSFLLHVDMSKSALSSVFTLISHFCGGSRDERVTAICTRMFTTCYPL